MTRFRKEARLAVPSRRTAWGLGAVLILSIVVLSISVDASQQDAGGGNAVQLLRDGIGASGRAMGGAWTALASGTTSAFWNPAPAIQTPSLVFGGAYEERSGGLFSLSYVGGEASLGMWRIGGLTVQSDLYDAYILSGGLVWQNVSVGAGANAYAFGVPGQRGMGLGLNAGLRYKRALSKGELTIAFVSRDIGWTNIVWRALNVRQTDFASWVTRAGLSVGFQLGDGQWVAEVDAELALNRPRLEGEVDYWKRVADASICVGIQGAWQSLRGRLGLQNLSLPLSEARARACLGIGFSYSNLLIDITLVPSPLGSTYLGEFSVTF